MRFVAAFVLSVIIIALVVVGYAYSGLYNVAATSDHEGVVAWLLSTTFHASVERRADDIVVPDLSGEDRLLAGASDFDNMCAGCHGAPGAERTAIGEGLTPQPPELHHAAQEMTPAEVFWVVKHGVKMTGMPAWGISHADEELWPVVAFTLELPGMDARRYRSLLSRARERGVGHHDHSNVGPAQPPAQPGTNGAERADDHGGHDHDGHDH